jgi:hypothetical protein
MPSDFNNQSDRTMIRTENVIIDKRLPDPAFINQILRDKEIIDTPSGIVLSGMKAIGPP